MTKLIKLEDIKFPKSWEVEVRGAEFFVTKKISGEDFRIQVMGLREFQTEKDAKPMIADLKAAFKRAKERADAKK